MDEGQYQEYLLREQRLRSIYEDILTQLRKAEEKHPKWPSDPIRQIAVVIEEAGETLQAVLNLVEYREKFAEGQLFTDEEFATYKELEAKIEKEALHTGAMVFRFLQQRRARDSQRTA